jgi:endonuclease/exonuclease/phosphatase family metal-dependent hydrolase
MSLSPIGLNPRVEGVPSEEIYRIIREELWPVFPVLAKCGSTQELFRHPVYKEKALRVRCVLESPETGNFSRVEAPSRPSYRFLAWNLERGIQFDGQLEALRSHEYLKSCDVLLLTETDVGMARSANRRVAQDLARELGMYYAFAPCYLNLAKGAGVENEVADQNELGLHGNAILSRYPLGNVRAVHLKNGKDKMAGREKRLGRQTALLADVAFPDGTVTAVAVHLDAQSSQRHRRDQMRDVLDSLPEGTRAVIGGDWNTTTYNSSRAFHAIMGFWLRVFMGVENVIRNHYLHPYNFFERDLFRLIESRSFDYRGCNRLGERTTSYDADCVKTHKNLREWVPAWCFAFIRWALRNHEGKCPLKIDWFAARGLRAANPVILHEFRENRATPLSDHDAIGLDVAFDDA